jgi:hypothetical protein
MNSHFNHSKPSENFGLSFIALFKGSPALLMLDDDIFTPEAGYKAKNLSMPQNSGLSYMIRH